MTDPADLSIAAARAEVAVGHLEPAELVEAVLARVAARDGELNAYLHVDGDAALAAARAAPPGPLRGIPVCVKDVIDVAGMPTTAGTAEWRRTPAGDAPAVARLRAAGAVVWGRATPTSWPTASTGATPTTATAATRVTRAGSPAARPRVPPRRWWRAWPWAAWAPTPPARCASPPRCAERSGCVPRWGRCLEPGCSRWPGPTTWSARWRGRWLTAPCCSRRWPTIPWPGATTGWTGLASGWCRSWGPSAASPTWSARSTTSPASCAAWARG